MTSIKPTAILKGEGLPDYDKITPNEITKNIPKLIKELNEELNKLEEQLEKQLATKSSLSWEDVMPQLYDIGNLQSLDLVISLLKTKSFSRRSQI